MAKFIVGDKLLQALYETGAIGEDYMYITRVVIDLKVGSAARMYVEKLGDDAQLVAGLTAGIEIVETAEEAGRTGRAAPHPVMPA